MEKICKRCGFRTPSARVICQVCGNTKFLTADTQNVQQDAAVAPKISAINMMQELLKRTMESASKYASSVLEKLSTAHESAPATEALARAQALVTVSTRGAEELSAEQAFVGKSLDELIAWFKSYGVDQPLILQPKDHQRSDYSQELNSKAA